LLVPSGYGKTIILAFIALYKWLLFELKTIIVVPTKLLAHQFVQIMKFVNRFDCYSMAEESGMQIFICTFEELKTFKEVAVANGWKIEECSLQIDEFDAAFTENLIIYHPVYQGKNKFVEMRFESTLASLSGFGDCIGATGTFSKRALATAEKCGYKFTQFKINNLSNVTGGQNFFDPEIMMETEVDQQIAIVKVIKEKIIEGPVIVVTESTYSPPHQQAEWLHKAFPNARIKYIADEKTDFTFQYATIKGLEKETNAILVLNKHFARGVDTKFATSAYVIVDYRFRTKNEHD
jgi:hypothetical protein